MNQHDPIYIDVDVLGVLYVWTENNRSVGTPDIREWFERSDTENNHTHMFSKLLIRS